MALCWMGYPIGGFLGTWLGAMIAPIYGWRVVFYTAGAAGLVVAFLYAVLVKNERKIPLGICIHLTTRLHFS